jgi:hypothetical protein
VGAVARELDCTLLIDEFYSHYVYGPGGGERPMESAARYVEDVEQDPWSSSTASPRTGATRAGA